MAILETIGGAVLSAFLQVLFDRLSSPDFVDFVQANESVHEQLKKLKIMLLSVNAALNDAEEKQLRDPAVREWLSELDEAIFDADDLVDEINTRALESHGTATISSSLSDFFTGSNCRIVKIMERLEFIIKQKDFLGLKEGEHVAATPLRGSPLAPLEHNSSTYGRDEDKEKILDLLRSEEVSVISIVGMGGIGKTTLAQIVYSDDQVKRDFDVRAWTSVSSDFDISLLTKALLEAVTCRTSHVQDLYPLQVQLELALRGKKFLLVLDHVWNENYLYWDSLRSPFESGSPGSKIIVTARSEKVASMMSNVKTYRLKEMSEESSWSLFAKHAFDGKDVEANPDLKSVAEQVVKRCRGVPLALKSLAGLLRFEESIEEWEKMLASDIWELNEKEHNILPALWLSYCHLPPHLKRCFAYCSIFPKKYQLGKEQLVSLWMAEDLLRTSSRRRMEDVGEEYIRSLVSRSLFETSSCDPLNSVTMHELVHDLATLASRGFCRRLDNDDDSLLLESKLRYLSFTNDNISAHEGIKKFELLALSKKNTLRSFLPFGRTRGSTTTNNYVLPKIPEGRRLRVISLLSYRIREFPQPLANFKHLRYFDLSYTEVGEIPDTIGTLLNLQTLLLKFCSNLTSLSDSIGNLKHLRYLDLSSSKIREIPDAICDLSNLQTLMLSNCKNISQLPTNMGRLTSLRHLNVACTNLKRMPLHMSRLKNLKTLTNFVVGEGSSSTTINELQKLQHIQGDLAISGLENVADNGDILRDNLNGKKSLRKLLLQWKPRFDVLNEEKQVLEKLQPNTNLKELSIELYNGRFFPSWMGDESLSKMVKLSLIDCRHCSSLPSLGQLPSLEMLEIRGFDKLETIGSEFYNSDGHVIEPFKSLKILYFDDMAEWRTWSLVGANERDDAFPRLDQLCLVNCPRLSVVLPDRLLNVTKCL